MTGTRGELAGPDWIEITIKFIAKYLLFPSQILFYLILDLQSGQWTHLLDQEENYSGTTHIDISSSPTTPTNKSILSYAQFILRMRIERQEEVFSGDVYADRDKCQVHGIIFTTTTKEGWLSVHPGQCITVRYSARTTSKVCMVDLVVDGIVRATVTYGQKQKHFYQGKEPLFQDWFYSGSYRKAGKQAQGSMNMAALDLR